MPRVYTKTGDEGTTGLFGGSRVHKDSLRLHCYGTIDEASAMIGLSYALAQDEEARSRLNAIQRRLFAVAAELASDEKGTGMLKDRIGEGDITYLENIIDACMDFVGDTRGFVVPGVNSFSAALHSARTVVRRAERHIVELGRGGEPVRDELRRYINRLSDCLFAIARREEELVKVRMIKDKVVEKLGAAANGCAPRLDLSTARKLALFAEEKARQIDLPIVFSVVDQGGNLILLNRMEGALLASIDIAIKKAYTANALKLPTDVAGELSKPDATLRGLEKTNDNRFVLFGGGFPYKVNGEVVGGIGVSGGSVEQDMEIATYALNRIQGRDE